VFLSIKGYMTKRSEKTCVICGSESGTLSYVRHLDCLFYRCLKCNHEVLSNTGDQEKEVYFDCVQELFYEEKADWILSPFSRWISAQAAKGRIKLVKRLLGNGKILEVGPGSGEFLMAAAKERFEVEAVECSRRLCSHLRSISSCKIYDGTLEEVDFGNSMFDAVLSFHVIEHVPDPKMHLECTARIVNPGGYLIFTTPNARSWDRRTFKSRWTGYQLAHLNLFSRESMELCLESAGWSVLDISTKESAFDLLYSIKTAIKPKKRNLEEKLRDPCVKSMPFNIGRVIFSCFTLLTLPFCYLQTKLGGGNELLVVAERRH
jgi:2-polyprenyl-3-methyl-5-hydroxy-6-metoxy-1,4-benzoquinol methylase